MSVFTPLAQVISVAGLGTPSKCLQMSDSHSPTALPSEQVSPYTVASFATTCMLPICEVLNSPGCGDRDVSPAVELVYAASRILAAHATAGDEACQRPSKKSRDAVAADVAAVLADLVDAGLVTQHTLICLVSLTDRISDVAAGSINTVTLKRFVAAAALLASKAERDEQRSLTEFATVSGVSVGTLRTTEVQLFTRLSFNVSTVATDFDAALDRLHIASGSDCNSTHDYRC